MIVSAYDVKPIDGQAADEKQLRAKLKTIKDACDTAKARTLAEGKGAQVDVLLYVDFNRHHQMWDGARVFGESSRTDEAEPMFDSV
jgi:hypothetical protein